MCRLFGGGRDAVHWGDTALDDVVDVGEIS